jgi:hypothetical protein
MGIDAGIALLCLGLPSLAAYGVMAAYEVPRLREKSLNAKLRSAFLKANTEADGLRKSLEGAELRMRDVRAATATIDQNLRQKLQRMPARDQAALDALIGQGTFAGLLSALRNGVLVDRRVSELERAWARGASERQCTQALCENLWILEPGLVSEGHIFLGKTLGSVAEGYFESILPNDDLAIAAAKKKPSAVGMFRRRSAIGRPSDPGQSTLVILEARRAGETIGQQVVGATISYAHAIRKLVPELGDWPIECWIVGGSIAEDAHFAASHGPPGTPIHLTTWDALTHLARTRRPETVTLRPIRFDANEPPVYRVGHQAAGLKSFLDLDDLPEDEAQRDQA